MIGLAIYLQRLKQSRWLGTQGDPGNGAGRRHGPWRSRQGPVHRAVQPRLADWAPEASTIAVPLVILITLAGKPTHMMIYSFLGGWLWLMCHMAAAACPRQIPPSFGGIRWWRSTVKLSVCRLFSAKSTSRWFWKTRKKLMKMNTFFNKKII